jgi:hypothetical protein
MRATIRLLLVILAHGCSSPETDNSNPPGIWLAGTATVAPGLEVPLQGILDVVTAPPDRSFASLACADSIDEPGVGWGTGSPIASQIDYGLTWKAFRDPTLPQIRAHVVIMADPMEANRRATQRQSPVLPGDLYGSTRVIDVPCHPKLPPDGCYTGSFESERVVLDGVFETCLCSDTCN